MPKLDEIHIVERMEKRLEQLQRGEEVAARDLRALLTDEQAAAMDGAWAEQQALRKKKRARTKEEEIAFGWKTKRDIHIEVLKRALNDARDVELAAWEKRAIDAEVRQARIFFNELGKQLDAGIDMQTAKTRANNELTRAGLRRLDGQAVERNGLNRRDREVRDIEDAIRQKAESELNDTDREQLELSREHDKAVEKNRKQQGS